MANVSPLPANAALSAAMLAPATPTDDSIVVPAIIQSLPDSFTDLSRAIQVNGVPVALSQEGGLTLQTAAGIFSLQILASPNATLSVLSDVLTSLSQNSKSLSLTVQPGSPPTQALLTLPNPSTGTGPPLVRNEPAETGAPFQGALFAKGHVLTATILPQDVARAFTASSLSEALSFIETSSQAAESLAKSPAPLGITSMPHVSSSSVKLVSLANFLKSAGVTNVGDTLKSFVQETSSRLAENKGPSAATQDTASTTALARIPALEPGVDWTVRVDSIVLPDDSLPIAASPNQVNAMVIGKGPSGHILLNANGNLLLIRQSDESVPVGSKVQLTLLNPKTDSDLAFQPDDDQKLPALQKIIAALTADNSQIARQFLQLQIPQPNDALPGALLFFLNALGQRGAESWLGSKAVTQLARANKGDLIAKLDEELQQAGGLARDPLMGQWRVWPMPIYSGQQIQVLDLYVRRERDRQASAAGYPVSPQTRFLITMNMSRLGPMQMDGLSQKKQLDIIIRSEHSLPPGLPNELRTTYLKTLDALGLTGSINFQTGKQHWVSVQKTTNAAEVVT